MNLEHQGIITKKRGEGNVGAAANDAKFLTSSWSSAHIPYNVWTWIIWSSSKQRRGKERGDLAKKKQQLLSKHRAAADGVCCTAIGVLVCIKTANMTWIWVVRGAAIYCNLRFFFYLCNCNTQSVKLAEKPQNLSKDHGSMQTLHWHMERVNKIDMRLIWQTRCKCPLSSN